MEGGECKARQKQKKRDQNARSGKPIRNYWGRGCLRLLVLQLRGGMERYCSVILGKVTYA